MSALCLARDGTAANHCWHRVLTAYLTNPPQWGETCCHCGEVRRMIEQNATDRPYHGPFSPEPR